ncbi:MAG: peptide-methionine (S)-S-oxide reductase MsrA [Rhodoglobus sp.]
MHAFVLAGGCFWCLDAVYRSLRGVADVVSGYTGGATEHPDYESVCTGATGHAEAVAITFDSTVIPEQVVLDVFFTLHDPRQLNRQGNDVGTQYRSAMFFADAAQKDAYEAARNRASEYWDGRLATTLEPLGEWYRAEDYHQNFFAKNPSQGYCLAVALPKVRKIREAFADYVLTS